jgi:hypothetical protein
VASASLSLSPARSRPAQCNQSILNSVTHRGPRKELKAAVEIFDDFKHKPLRPINEIDQDEVRAELDRRFAIEVLGLPAALVQPDRVVELARRKLAQEPSIQGGKQVGESDEEEEDEE